MSDLAIVNGTVVIPGSDPAAMDITVTDGTISGLGEPGSITDATQVIDATGLHVFPGAIDPHIHLGGYQPLETAWPNFSMKHIAEVGHIYPVFRELFAKQSA